MPTYDPLTGNWNNDNVVDPTVPATGDNGVNYGAGVLDLFKFGVGAYFANDLAKFENKNQYNSAGGQTYQNGLPASTGLNVTGGNQMIFIIGGIAVLIAVVFLIKD